MSGTYQARGHGPRVGLYPKVHPRQAQSRVTEERAQTHHHEAASAQTGLQRDNSLLGRWWWSVDRWTLGAIFILIGFGYIMMLAASPAVAERIGTSRDLFIFKQVFFLAIAAGVVFGVSLLSPRDIRRLAIIGCLIALALTAATMFIGVEIKGARRWISLPGMSVQPSEFLKPCFAVVAAWLLAEGKRSPRFPGMILACAVFTVILLLLKSQPDIGMLAVVTVVFLTQLYVAGLPIVLVGIAVGMLGAGSFAAYAIFPHVRSRVTRFWDGTGDNYQVTTALEAFGNGGLLGRGPGEGRVKDILPDAHADFVFAVAGEEFGMILCVVIIAIFGFIVLRGLLRLLKEHDPFIVLSCTGLVTGFGLQAFVNMASTLKLIPTKGMTLPFISYGGSSVVAVALGMGMLLALTRKRGRDERP
jgi:cell division protein FtsW